jgi:hypothetical protein
MPWRTRAAPSAGKVLTRFRKPREGLQPFSLVPTRPSCRRGRHGHPSAVIGCHSVDAMDVGGQKRSWVDVSGQPPPVLKTAGQLFAAVHQRPLGFSCRDRQSVVVRCRPQSSASLAVILAVSPRGRGWLDGCLLSWTVCGYAW